MYRRTRFARRRRRIRHRRRHVFGKKATRAIKAISQKPVETKWYIFNSDVLVDVPPVSWPSTAGNEFAVYRNIMEVIPRSNNVGTESRSEVVGQKFNMRGVSIKGFIAWVAGATANAQQMRIRMTVLRSTVFYDVPQFGVLSAGSAFYEDDDNLPLTAKSYDTDRIHIIKSKIITLGPPVNSSPRVFNMWVPMRNTLTCWDDEGSGVTATTVGRLKDFQYYLVLEFQSPMAFQWAPGQGEAIKIRTKVYFKDP